MAATPPFMSCEPRPYRRPLRTSGSNGRAMPATPTVSVWPQNINDRPGARPSQHADDVRPARRDLGDMDVEPERSHLLGQPPRDRQLPCRARHERRVHRVDGHEIAEQATEGVWRGGHEAVVQHRPAPTSRTHTWTRSQIRSGPSRPSREAVQAAGGRALVVGGWVRDRLLQRASKDVDIEVFGVPGDRLHALLRGPGARRAGGQQLSRVQGGGTRRRSDRRGAAAP